MDKETIIKKMNLRMSISDDEKQYLKENDGCIKIDNRRELVRWIGICLSLGITDLNCLCTTYIFDMSNLFPEVEKIEHIKIDNIDISRWDVSNVTNMSQMFYGLDKFNCNLDHWDVSNVENMMGMFGNCTSFNSPLSNWNLKSLGNAMCMFHNCKSFNQDLTNWDIKKIKIKIGMFDCIGSNTKLPKGIKTY